MEASDVFPLEWLGEVWTCSLGELLQRALGVLSRVCPMWGLRRKAPPMLALMCVVVAAAAGVLARPALAAARAAGSFNPVLKIESADDLPAQRRVIVPLHKAIVVELPVDNHDIIVSRPETLDASVHSPRRIVLYAKSLGEANAFFLGRDGRKLLILDITVQRDVSDLSDLLKQVLPGSHIKVAMSGTGVVLTGSVGQPADAARAEDVAKQFVKDGSVVNLIAVGEREQVLLKVTVAEIQRDAVRRLGVNLPEAVAKAGSFTFAKVMANSFPVSTAVAASAGFVGAGQVPALSGGTAVQLSQKWAGGSVSAIIETFERAGLSRTLAEPTLTAISGETAKFLAGGEFPVPLANTNNTLSVSFKSFGVNVSFTPYVLSEGRINLKVSAEVSEISSHGAVTVQGLSIPALQVRRAETAVEMPSGSALAMAGLLSDQTRQNVDGFPELRTLPVLGALFRSKDYLRSESELVILVTPYVVKPGDPDTMSRPDEGFAPPSDLRGLFLGSLNRIYSNSAARAADRDVGFIVAYPEHGELK